MLSPCWEWCCGYNKLACVCSQSGSGKEVVKATLRNYVRVWTTQKRCCWVWGKALRRWDLPLKTSQISTGRRRRRTGQQGKEDGGEVLRQQLPHVPWGQCGETRNNNNNKITYLAVKRNAVLMCVTTWMNLGHVQPSERSQTQKLTYCMVPFISLE